MTRSRLGRLQSWYAARCDGEWEHQRGVVIGTLDNPGWNVEVSLVGTPLEGRPFADRIEERSEEDWVHFRVKDGVFRGYGGAENLVEMVEFFLAWAEEEHAS